MLTRLGEVGVGAFTIPRIAGDRSIAASQRYVHPSPGSLARAIEKLKAENKAARFEVGTKPGTVAPGQDSEGKLISSQ